MHLQLFGLVVFLKLLRQRIRRRQRFAREFFCFRELVLGVPQSALRLRQLGMQSLLL